MTLYNPFKPHIVTNGEVYRIRRISLFGWQYLGTNAQYWWTFAGYEYSIFTTKEEAETLLKKCKYTRV